MKQKKPHKFEAVKDFHAAMKKLVKVQKPNHQEKNRGQVKK